MSDASAPPLRDRRALDALRERRVGVWTSALDAVAPADAGRHAAEVEALGYGSLFFGEAYGREAFTNAGLLLAATEQLVVGTGIANIYGRDATAGNAASRTLHDAHPGRFIAGWGVSHAPLVERLRGHDYGKPLAAARSYFEALDAAPFAATGEPMPPPRLLAALRPKMLALAATHADGAHPYLVTPEHTARARAALGPDRVLVVEQAVVLTDDEAIFRARAHWHLEIYTGLPNYRNSWIDLGFTQDDAVRGGSDRLKDALVAGGDADRIARRVQAHLDAGADHVVIQALGEHLAAVPADQWRALTPTLTAL